jgi:flagellar P-ring protein precursor FlgI
VIGGDVEIGPVVVTHKNIVIEATSQGAGAEFVQIDLAQPNNPRLQALVAALDALRVPSDDVIDIIKDLHRNGQLHAQLIIE